MREKEKEREKKRVIQSYPHDYKRNKSFHGRGERKEKSYLCNFPRAYLSFFLQEPTTLYSTTTTTTTLLLVFLYEIIKVSP